MSKCLMHIYVDEREHTLYSTLVDLVAYHRQGAAAVATTPVIQVTKKVLVLGDILIEHPDGRPALLVERKTLSDLLSSIRDSRYDEQSYRLVHASGFHPHNIVYVIEGVMGQLSQQKDRDLVYSASFSLNHYKGFSVFRTATVLETAQWLWAVTTKIHRNAQQNKAPRYAGSAGGAGAAAAGEAIGDAGAAGEEGETVTDDATPTHGAGAPTPPPYCSVVKKVKKDNVTTDNWGEIVLCQIPSVSAVSATAILQRYRTLAQLMAALQADPHCLDGITTVSAGKSRKLSSAVVANVRKFLVDPAPASASASAPATAPPIST